MKENKPFTTNIDDALPAMSPVQLRMSGERAAIIGLGEQDRVHLVAADEHKEYFFLVYQKKDVTGEDTYHRHELLIGKPNMLLEVEIIGVSTTEKGGTPKTIRYRWQGKPGHLRVISDRRLVNSTYRLPVLLYRLPILDGR